jgi:hypothetical protein
VSLRAEAPIHLWLWAGFKPWLIWLIFALIGPLVGLTAMLVVSSVWEILYGTVERAAFFHSPVAWCSRTIGMVALAYPWALLFGGVQAALVGVVAALSYVGWGRVSFAAVMIASTLTFIGLSLLAFGSARSTEPVTWQKLASMALPHLSAGFVCWLVVAPLRRNVRSLASG